MTCLDAGSCVAAALLVGVAFSSGASAASPFDPIAELTPLVFTGSQVPALLGTPVGRIWAYRFDGATVAFQQVPVQVDERRPFDLTHGQQAPVYELTYDWLHGDGGLLDEDDEIALMARDAGARAPNTDEWVVGADDTRIELRIDDPLSGARGWLYLFTSAVLSDEDPSFAYVTYAASDATSGVAVVDSPTYMAGYEGRWRLTRLEVHPHPNLLDRVKVRAFALVGSETEETYERTSEMLGAYSGKVRALREVQGAASGVLTTHVDAYYRDAWRRTVNLRVHPISHIWTYNDYAAPPSAGRFYSATIGAPGLSLDGVNDPPPPAALPEWSQASLPYGTMVSCVKQLTPFPLPPTSTGCYPDAGVTFYWRDDASYSDGTGNDASAYGNHGAHLRCTADTNTSPYVLATTTYPLPPQSPYSPVGDSYAERERNPLGVTPAAQARAALTDAMLGEVRRVGDGRLAFRWIDALGEDAYEIYRGVLTSPFLYDHDTALQCGLPPDTLEWTTPDDQEKAQPGYYYLVVSRRGANREYGTDSTGSPRPPSASPCP
jgi:hypothetical protein